MKFRLSWHWNAAAGDPYYALDCREDDYAWCNATPDGKLIPWIEFERLREGLDDYRRLLTLARLAKEKAGTPAAQAARKLIATRLAAFKLGQRDHEALFPAASSASSAGSWTRRSRPWRRGVRRCFVGCALQTFYGAVGGSHRCRRHGGSTNTDCQNSTNTSG